MNIGDKVSTTKGPGMVIEVNSRGVVIGITEGFLMGETFQLNNPQPVKKEPKKRAARKFKDVGKIPMVAIHREDLPEFCDPAVLGFLASAGEFTIESVKGVKEKLMATYEAAANHEAWDESCYFSYHKKWGTECRINFFANEEQVARLGLIKYAIPRKYGAYYINCNDLWWDMVRIGFRMGRSHNIDMIRASTGEGQANFDFAFAAACGS